MKKAYFQPSVDVLNITAASVLCASADPSPLPPYTPMSMGAPVGDSHVVGD